MNKETEETVIEPQDPKTIVDNVKVRDRRKLITPVFIALIVALISSGISNLALAFIAADTNKVVGYINDQTSPEHQRLRDEAVRKAFATIDCNVRFAFQESLDQLERQGVLEPDSVTITDNCPPTTTTTAP